MLQKQLILFLLIVCCCQITFSQVEDPKKDSSGVSQNIDTLKKRKTNKLFRRLIFRPVNLKTKKEKVIPKNYSIFEGKIIRKINIVTLDPFGYSEIDSTRKPKNWAEKSGNRLHLKTKRLAILNLLLIKKNKPLDSLLIKESERLIRTQRYISRVDISPRLISNNPDSVDVYIRILDSWSLTPQASFSNSNFSFKLNERNFFGSGHQFNNEFKKRMSDGKNAYNTKYIIPTIKNTFIKTTLNYRIDLDDDYSKIIDIERLFFSPFTKWAGGIYLDQQFINYEFPDSLSKYTIQKLKYNSYDFWLGKAFSIYKRNNTENKKTTNLILTARFLNIKYLESPTIAYDSIHFFSSEKFILSGIGITSRKYIQDKYIFKNGIIEDVPIGKTLGITVGYQRKNHLGRYYLGGQAAFGNFYKFGFVSANFELGTFFDKAKTKQTALTFQANYFTNLMSLGKWKLRQFIKPQFIIGINRENSIGDQLTINEEYGILGFKSNEYGTKKAVLTLQTQAYSPWNLWGFRLNPFFNYSIAALGNTENRLINSKIYSKIGIGFIINNDFLTFSSFQLSLSYYPTIPDSGDNIFKTNTFETTDLGFQDFELAKPRTVIYK